MQEHLKKINKLAKQIIDDENYTPKFCFQNQIFVPLTTLQFTTRTFYTLVENGMLKVKKVKVGKKKERVRYSIKGNDLKKAMFEYYKIKNK